MSTVTDLIEVSFSVHALRPSAARAERVGVIGNNFQAHVRLLAFIKKRTGHMLKIVVVPVNFL